MLALSIPFNDTYPSYSAIGHVVTNEEADLHIRLLGTRRFTNVATIASGGEIAFMVLLARCKKLIAVDHSYRALAGFYLKALLLDTLGPAGLQKLIVETDYNTFIKACEKVSVFVPEILRNKPYFKFAEERLKADDESPYPYSATSNNYTNAVFTTGDFRELRQAWKHAPLASVKAGLKNLANLTVMHGDLSDLNNGPFDLIYISNALAHTDRTGRTFSLAKIIEKLTADGLILSTTNLHKPLQMTQVGIVTGIYTHWIHALYQRKPSVATPSSITT